MRRTIYISVFILLLSLQLSGQEYRVIYSGDAQSEGCAPDPIQNSWVRIYLEDGANSSLLLNSNCGTNDAANNEEVIISFKPTQIRQHAYALSNMGFVVLDETEITNINLAHCDNAAEVFSFGDISFSIEPIIEISSPSVNPTSACDPIVLNASNSGFDADMYNWEYYTDAEGSWNPLPGFQGMPGIQVGIADIPAPGISVGETVQFRITYCGNMDTAILVYSFSACSPGLVGDPVITPPDCSYNNNGSFTVSFDRDLLPGETIDFNLYQGGMGGGAPLFTQNGVNALDPGNSYIWPAVLEPDTYYLQYQSNPAGSLSGFTEIIIPAPTPVTFDAIWTNINCFGENTGSIDITAAGGTQSYEYRLNNGSWTNFSNQFTHALNGLSAGNFQVRVRDTNGCTEQQTP